MNLGQGFEMVLGVTRAAFGDPNAWEASIRKMERSDRRRPPASGGIVFTGSSSFALWDTLERGHGAAARPQPRLRRRAHGRRRPLRRAHRAAVPAPRGRAVRGHERHRRAEARDRPARRRRLPRLHRQGPRGPAPGASLLRGDHAHARPLEALAHRRRGQPAHRRAGAGRFPAALHRSHAGAVWAPTACRTAASCARTACTRTSVGTRRCGLRRSSRRSTRSRCTRSDKEDS